MLHQLQPISCVLQFIIFFFFPFLTKFHGFFWSTLLLSKHHIKKGQKQLCCSLHNDNHFSVTSKTSSLLFHIEKEKRR